jgi:hypothetical protein
VYIVGTTTDTSIYDVETHSHIVDLDTMGRKVVTYCMSESLELIALGCDLRRVFIVRCTDWKRVSTLTV